MGEEDNRQINRFLNGFYCFVEKLLTESTRTSHHEGISSIMSACLDPAFQFFLCLPVRINQREMQNAFFFLDQFVYGHCLASSIASLYPKLL